jgi:hypothetical protein
MSEAARDGVVGVGVLDLRTVQNDLRTNKGQAMTLDQITSRLRPEAQGFVWVNADHVCGGSVPGRCGLCDVKTDSLLQSVAPVVAALLEEERSQEAAIQKRAASHFEYAIEEWKRRAHLAEAETQALREALDGLMCGDCWCEAGIGNPMMHGQHSPQCLEVQRLTASSATPRG